MFANINMFTYTRPVKFNSQILNYSKAPEKLFGIFIIKIPNIYDYNTMIIILYSTKTNKNTTSQTILKY